MSAPTITQPRPPIDGGRGNGSGGWDGGSHGSGLPRRRPLETSRLGMLFAVAGIAMLFVALTSAYVVRMGTASQTAGRPAPPLLWVNTGILLVSSATLELARRAASRDGRTLRRGLRLTLVLGVLFVAGQLVVWTLLAAEGVYLTTNPHSSFFYVLTALHGLHLLGGITALAWLAFTSSGRASRSLDATALYWHFLDVLWLYMVVLLFVWR